MLFWPSERIRRAATLAALVTLMIAVYQPGLTGPFVFDDYPNIVDNPSLSLKSLSLASLQDAAFSKPAGTTTRPLAMLSFAIDRYMSDNERDAYRFKLTNLIIHIANTILIYVFLHLLLARHRNSKLPPAIRDFSPSLPLIVTAIWSLHPLNVNAVLYVVQRMTSLATLFMLAGLILFVLGRRIHQHSRLQGLVLMSTGAIVGSVFGLLAKEIALLLPLYLVVVDYTLLQGGERKKEKSVLWFHIATIGTLVAYAAYTLAVEHPLLAGYRARDFTLTERLLTETRVLWFYVSLLVFPVPGHFSLFHDDITISTGLFSPWTTITALLALLAITAIAITHIRRWPVLSFGILWFIAGHVMESSIIGLEIAHEHRNYLASLGPLFAIVCGLDKLASSSVRTPMLATIAISGIAVIAFSSFVRTQAWTSETTLLHTTVSDHPASPRAVTMLAEFYAIRENDPIHALALFHRSIELAPNDADIRLRLALLTTHPKLPIQLISNIGSDRAKDELSVNQTLLLNLTGKPRLRLQSAFETEIERVLTEYPLSSSARTTLTRLGACIIEPPHRCADLGAAGQRWHAAVTRNPSVSSAVRLDFTVKLFNIAVWRLDYRAALDAVSTGMFEESTNIEYSLMRANAYILLKQYGDAEETLNTIKEEATARAETKETYSLLQQALERRRGGN